MVINTDEKPVKKMAGLGEIFDESWELYINNIGTFIVYLLTWVAATLIVNIFFVYLPGAYRMDKETVDIYKIMQPFLPYIKCFMFLVFVFCSAAVTKAAMLRYDGEENNYKKVIKETAVNYLKYLTVFMTYITVILLAWKLATNRYLIAGFLAQADYRLHGIVIMALLVPFFYIIVRYFPVLTAVFAAPSGSGPFKTSSWLMEGHYGRTTLLILLLTGMAGVIFFIMLTTGLMYFDNGVSLLIGLPFVACVNVVLFRKLADYKDWPAKAPALKNTHPVFGVLLAALMSLLPLSMAFPEAPGKIFYSSDFLLGIFSPKMVFPGGIEIKRPAGWLVKSAGMDMPAEKNYYMNNDSKKYVNDIYIKSVLLKNAVFRKERLNAAEKKKLKLNILMLGDETDPGMCAYQVTDTADERNNKGEYPKGIFTRVSAMKTKEYTSTNTTVTFYRIVKNQYAITAAYTLSGYDNYPEMDEKAKKEMTEHSEKQAKESLKISAMLEKMILF